MRPGSLALAFTLLVTTYAPPAAAQQESRGSSDSVQVWLENAEREAGIELPNRSAIRSGNVTVAAGESIDGDLVTVSGDIEVSGVVEGDVAALDGDVLLRAGSRVAGSVVAAGGHVEEEGGLVEGEIVETVLRATEMPPPVRGSPVILALGWACVMAVIGLVALLLARRNLERVANAVRARFGRSLIAGIIGQLAFFPALLAIIVVLAITIIGVLVIPIALVAFLTAVAGAAALGFLAVAYASGESVLSRRRDAAAVSVPLALFAGLGIYVVAWVLAAALSDVAVIGIVLRGIVGLVTWVALTAGFGATILTRGGSRDAAHEMPEPVVLPDDMWQTPTPVSGVTAARRPTPAPRSYHQ